jgi:hypothetical protein
VVLGTVTRVSTPPDPAEALDAAEVDPDPGSTAELPGYSAGGGGEHDAAVGPPAQAPENH